MNKLKQIDNILKKAAAEVYFNNTIQSSDWDTIEHRLKKRKRRLIVLWSSVAIIFSAFIISHIVSINSSIEGLEKKEEA